MPVFTLIGESINKSNRFMQLDTIIKYIEGTTSRIEKSEIETWLLEDPGNQQYLKKVKKVWFAVDELKALSLIDVNKDWDAIEKRISGRSGNLNQPAGNKRVLLSQWAKIAAVFVLGIMIASLFFLPEARPFSKQQVCRPSLRIEYT